MIAIIGNNLTAKMTFLLMKKNDIEVLLLQKSFRDDEVKVHKEKFITRTMAISILNAKNLSEFVDLSEILDKSGSIDTIKIFDGTKNISEKITFNAKDFGYERMGYIIDYNNLQEFLDNEIKKYSDFIINPEEISKNESKFEIKLQNKSFFAEKLIISDNSCNNIFDFQISEKNFFKYDYKESAITLNIEHSIHHKNLAIEWFTKFGPLASLPMKDQNKSNIVRTMPSCVTSDIKNLNQKKDFIKEYILSTLESQLGNVKIISDIQIFPLSLFLNKSQNQNDNIIFLGTKKVIMHPIAGQGFNLIIRDIFRLINEIKNKNTKNTEKIDVFSILFATHNLNQLFKSDCSLLKMPRKLGMFIIENCNFLKKGFVKNAIGDGVFN